MQSARSSSKLAVRVARLYPPPLEGFLLGAVEAPSGGGRAIFRKRAPACSAPRQRARQLSHTTIKQSFWSNLVECIARFPQR